MSQSSSPSPSLHPTLSVALTSLDAPLDAELSLYRRQRHQSQATDWVHQSQEGDPNPAEPLALPSSAPIGGAVQPEDRPPASTPSVQNAAVNLPQPQSPLDSETQGEAEGAVEEPALVSKVDAAGTVDPGNQRSGLVKQPQQTPESFEQYLDPSIEDYLESSEALLQHLDDSEQAVTEPAPKGAPVPLRIWGIITVVAVVMVGCVGFVIANTTNLLKVFAPAEGPPSSPVSPSLKDPPGEGTASPSTASDSASPALGSATPKGPDLSAEEFVDLNLSNLGRVDPQQSNPGTTAAPNPIIAPDPTPTPVPVTPAPNQRSFYVVTDYTDAASLAAARRVVPDAYLSTLGDKQRIQLATLYDYQRAKEFVQSVKGKGLNATILTSN